ncbi:MAG TPA: DUF1080 domain-containing protein [Candidatus Saccharimonadales bacterium]|nr:DUF1080 domain-containing protein [Candidatus Saccharimonadales bacterium]
MRKILLTLTGLAVAGFGGFISQSPAEAVLGYTDTPMLPSGKWHVHDPARPVPPVVTPGATFSDGARPPADAIVLFSGHDLSQWESDKVAKGEKEKGEAKWKVRDGYMEVAPKAGGIQTKETFGDFQLHLEWAEPAKVRGNSQERGNSGVFLQGIYEVQVLDCYNNPTYPDGQCGAIYGQSPPLVNACRKPGQWQTYDIFFQAAKFDDDHKLTRPASVTVIQNGMLLHHKQAILGPTGHRTLANYNKETPARGPIGLQDHGNPVRFRNIWIRNINEEETP